MFLELNLLEICLLAVWAIGVIAALCARDSRGTGPRYLIVIAAAVFVPVVGTLIALARLAVVRRNARRTTARHQSA
jgi:energy-converting hydrogenase Eha subunit C